MRIFIIIVLLGFIVFERANDTGGVAAAQWFKSHPQGSTDYGVFKWGDDHVITVHGFADDMSSCYEVATALNVNACKETGGVGCLNPYSCKPLN